MKRVEYAFASVLGFLMSCASCHEEFQCRTPVIEAQPEWIAYGGFVFIILGIIVMFHGLTLICEEYCVPAISVLCLKYKISDNFAGSTIIGAGLSLPVLFASYVGLFASNSSIGLATVVGGNLFNQTINIAASIFVAPNKRLKLSKVVLSREIATYATSNFLIFWCVERNISHSFKNVLNAADVLRCLSVPWEFSLLLVGSFLAYCLFEAYFSTVIRFIYRFRHAITICGSGIITKDPQDCETGRDTGDCTTVFPEGSDSPSRTTSNNNAVEEQNPKVRSSESTYGPTQEIVSTNNPSLCKHSIERDTTTDESYTDEATGAGREELGAAVNLTDFILFKKPGECLQNLQVFGGNWERIHCSMHKGGYLSYRTKQGLPILGAHVRFVDLSNEEGTILTNSITFEFTIIAKHPYSRTFHFRAPDADTFDAVTSRLSAITYALKGKTPAERKAMASNAMDEITFMKDYDWGSNDPEESFGTTALVEGTVGNKIFVPPVHFFPLCFYYIVHPVRVMIYYSTPDVRAPRENKRALTCLVMCVVWMAAASYVIIQGLHIIGDLIRVNGAIMGLTVGAWAASYPALWSSIVVARDGHGDIVACNALGSNVFNNCIGIGLPWLTYSMVNNFRNYGEIQDGGIVLSFLILSVILVVFYVVLALNDFTLRLWMAYTLCVVYTVSTFYLCYQMA